MKNRIKADEVPESAEYSYDWQVCTDAYAVAKRFQRSSALCQHLRMYDASAMYMRKTIEVMTDALFDRRAAEIFDYAQSKDSGVDSPSLVEKTQWLGEHRFLPARAVEDYDGIRRFGNEGVHQAFFDTDRAQIATHRSILDIQVDFFKNAFTMKGSLYRREHPMVIFTYTSVRIGLVFLLAAIIVLAAVLL